MIFNSKFIANFYIKKFKRKNFNNYKVIGCSYKNFSPSKFNKKENSILYVSGFYGLKNHKYLIDFFMKYEKSYKLYLAGVDYDVEYYNLCKKLSNNSKKIILLKNPSDIKIRKSKLDGYIVEINF